MTNTMQNYEYIDIKFDQRLNEAAVFGLTIDEKLKKQPSPIYN